MAERGTAENSSQQTMVAGVEMTWCTSELK